MYILMANQINTLDENRERKKNNVFYICIHFFLSQIISGGFAYICVFILFINIICRYRSHPFMNIYVEKIHTSSEYSFKFTFCSLFCWTDVDISAFI